MDETIQLGEQCMLGNHDQKEINTIANLQGATLIFRIFLVNMVSVSFSVVLGILSISILDIPTDVLMTNAGFLYMINIITMLIANVVPFVLLLKSSKIKINALFPISKISFSLIIAGVVVCLGLNFILSMATSFALALLDQLFHVQAQVPNFIPQSMDFTTFLLFFVFTCIVAPITEEFMFRGVLLAPLRKYGDWFAVVVTSILFSLVHGNLGQIPGAFIIGLVLGFITIKSGSIVPAIIIHFINNAFAVLQSYIIAFQTQEILLNLMGFFMIVMMFGSVFILISNRQKIKLSMGTIDTFTIKKYYKIYFSSIGLLLFLVFMIFSIITTLI